MLDGRFERCPAFFQVVLCRGFIVFGFGIIGRIVIGPADIGIIHRRIAQLAGRDQT